MPIPVSDTSIAIALGAKRSTGCSADQSARDRQDPHLDLALRRELEGVRQQVLQDLLQALGVAGEGARQRVVDLDLESQVLRFGEWWNVRSTLSLSALKVIASGSTVTVPDSIFDRSRMSLMSVSRSVPAEWMFRAKSTCFDTRFL